MLNYNMQYTAVSNAFLNLVKCFVATKLPRLVWPVAYGVKYVLTKYFVLLLSYAICSYPEIAIWVTRGAFEQNVHILALILFSWSGVKLLFDVVGASFESQQVQKISIWIEYVYNFIGNICHNKPL